MWYDDGIELAEDYPEYVADHVSRCASFVLFVSEFSLASAWCKSEVNYTLDLNKRILLIYLQDVELKLGFLALLPDDLRANVVAVTKRTNNVGKATKVNDTSVVSDTADRLRLLSMSEFSPVGIGPGTTQITAVASLSASASSHPECSHRARHRPWRHVPHSVHIPCLGYVHISWAGYMRS